MEARSVSGVAVVAALGIVLLAMRVELAASLTAGTLLAVALLPVWLPEAARSVAFRWIGVLGVLCLVSGLVLGQLAGSDHAVSRFATVRQSLLVIELVTATGWILWSRRHLPQWGVAALFGVGLVAAIRPGAGMFADNPWRFGFSVPLTVLFLAMAGRTSTRWLGAVTALGLGAASAVAGGRSTFAMLFLTGVIVLWQGRRTVVSRPRSAVRILALFAALGFAAYSVGQALILDGYLGGEAQVRSQAQIETSGSLILGGRPESVASLALIGVRPQGYGAGTIPSLGDILLAKSAMAGINYDPNNGYVESFMFGGRFEVHSVLGDLWIWFGVAGAALAVTILVVSVRGLAAQVAARTASALLVFLVAKTAWNIAFSPVASAVPLTALTLGLLLTLRTPARASRGASPHIHPPERTTRPR